MNKEEMFTSTLEECTQNIYDGDILLAKSVGKGPREKRKKSMTSAIWGVQCQTLSVPFTPKISLKGVLRTCILEVWNQILKSVKSGMLFIHFYPICNMKKALFS